MSQKSHSSFLSEKIWIIGASAGIGKALALYLDQQGAQLILSSRKSDTLSVVADMLSQPHEIITCDVSDPEAFASAFAQISQQTIDRIIYLPAMYQPMLTSQLQRNVVEATIQHNLTAVFYLLENILPYLQKNPTCQLAVAASIAGYVGLPKAQPYAATKAAIINLMESIKSEHPEYNLKLINPGFVKTRLTDKNNFKMPMLQTPERAAQYIADGLLARGFEIHFPKRLTYLLKVLRCLPYPFYFSLLKNLLR